MLKYLIPVGAVVLGLAAANAVDAGSPVAPDTLQPVPPPGATCSANGPWVICKTGLVIDAQNEPIEDFDLPCGTVHESIHDVRSGIRWYQNGKLVKRFVTQDAEGTWSLSPTGDGPTARISAHANWRNVYAVPGDESSGPTTAHGDGFKVQATGHGVIVHFAGLDLADGSHRGVARFIDDPAVAARLCDALAAAPVEF